MTAERESTVSTDTQAHSEARRRTAWIVIALVLVVVFSATSLWMLHSMDKPPTTGIVAVLGLVLVAILLAPVLFEITELSVGKEGISAKMRHVEEKVEAASRRIDNLRDEILLKLAGQYGIETYERRSAGYRQLWRTTEPLALYFRTKPVTYKSLSELARMLTHWYFDYGMFLSADGRDRYFFLQDVIQSLRQEENNNLLPEQDALNYYETDMRDLELFSLFNAPKPDPRMNTKWKDELFKLFTIKIGGDKSFFERLRRSSDYHFALVRCAASALRTQMAEDLKSREMPEF